MVVASYLVALKYRNGTPSKPELIDPVISGRVVSGEKKVDKEIFTQKKTESLAFEIKSAGQC
jgi:hypothetical protein